MRLRSALRLGAVSLALCLMGAGIASAFSYGTLSVYHNGALRGQGYGTFSRSGYNQVRLTSTLSDTRADDTRTFVSGKGYGANDAFSVQSGRRDDGGRSFARMVDRYGYSSGAMIGHRGYIKVCQDVKRAPDWCSREVSSGL